MHHKWNDKERLERVGQATDSNERKGYPVGWIPEAGKRRRTTRRGRGIAARNEEECCRCFCAGLAAGDYQPANNKIN
ncbi:AAA family ATPase [Aspergillus luchuensis]|uniref:AAA family ATPase n=1 Tax=Aspergillus kawachii TaxID=1069201 RepID=A0A146FSH9_ASPKA|nr:AAA family ATPase [Aspergillus luchuensis]